MYRVEVDVSQQKMMVYHQEQVCQEYFISTAKNGVGENYGSEKTPRGWHIIRAKIGANQPYNTVFVERRPTGEIYHLDLRKKYPERDWILTRIMWLSGLEIGKNRLHDVDTMRRYIYIHGSPEDVKMGIPGSRGCIRMRNKDILQLFEQISVGTRILIK